MRQLAIERPFCTAERCLLSARAFVSLRASVDLRLLRAACVSDTFANAGGEDELEGFRERADD